MSKLSQNLDSILTKQQLEQDYLELKYLNKIAKKYHLSTTAIHNRFKKYNIVIKKSPELYQKDHNVFSKDTENSFYLAGFIAADGCIRIAKTNKNTNYINYRLVIALSEKDESHLYKIKEILKCENPIGKYISKKKNPKWNDTVISKLSVSSKQMITDLERFNIFPRKSLTYNMPDWLKHHDLLHHFIRGYADGDGSFYINHANDNISFSLRGTLPFLENIKEIFKVKCEVETNSVPRESGGIGQFSIHSNKYVSKITDYLYNDATVFLPRKYEKAIKSSQILSIQENAKKEISLILERK
jgi:hypothetical protein